MAEETNIQIVGNVLRRLHPVEETATSAGTVLVDYDGRLVPSEVYLPTAAQYNITTTVKDQYDVSGLLPNEPLAYLYADPVFDMHYGDLYAFVHHVAHHGGPRPIAKNIPWRTLVGSRFTTDSRSSTGTTYAEVILTNRAEIGTATAVPEIGELTRYLVTFSRLPYAKVLADRILEIDKDLMEEAEGERLSSRSVFSLIRFLHSNTPIARPALAAGVGGYLIARWKSQNNREINVHFHGDGNASFYASVPGEENAAKREFLSATSLSIESLATRLMQLQILGWMR
jgi:hypothetical protein